MLIRNPIIWLWRIPRRRGYGIHSPFAYNLVTQVLYCPGRYYADERLDRLHPWYVRLLRLRPLSAHRLLFRLANHWQPNVIEVPAEALTLLAYLHAGCQKAHIRPCHNGIITLQGTAGTMFVVYDLQRHRDLWREVRADGRVTVTFDLWDVGIAVCDPKLNKKDYIINW